MYRFAGRLHAEVLLLAGCATLLAGCGASAPPAWTTPGVVPQGSVVLLGVDGLDRELAELLASQGRMPNFSRLCQEGLATDLHVEPPLLSPRIWTSIASGVAADQHGITDWSMPDGTPFGTQHVQVPRMWDAAGAAGLEVLVSGWLMTTPVQRVNGVMLSDELVLRGSLDWGPDERVRRDKNVGADALAWPGEVLKAARSWIPSRRDLAGHRLAWQMEDYGEDIHPLPRDEAHVRSFEVLAPSRGARLSMVYVGELDQISHQYWSFVDPEAAGLLRGDPASWRRYVERARQAGPVHKYYPWADRALDPSLIDEGARWVTDAYLNVDDIIGRFMARVDPLQSTLIVVSDHGFRVNGLPSDYHADHDVPGFFAAWGRAVRPGAVPARPVEEEDIAPTVFGLLGIPGMPSTGSARADLFSVEPSPVTQVESTPFAVAPRDRVRHDRQKELEMLGYLEPGGQPVAR